MIFQVLKMNDKQKEYLIDLIKHDLSHFEFIEMDLKINKQEVLNLLDEIEVEK